MTAYRIQKQGKPNEANYWNVNKNYLSLNEANVKRFTYRPTM